MAKLGNPEVETEVIEIVKDAKIPVSVTYVKRKTKMSHIVTHSILLDLVLKDKLQILRTTGQQFFLPNSPTFLNVDEKEDMKVEQSETRNNR